MQYITSLTSKGQATIPVALRRKLKIRPGQKVLFEENGNSQVVIKRLLSVSELKGSLKTNIKWNKKKADEAVGKMLAKRYERKITGY